MRNCTACNKLLTCAKPKRGTPPALGKRRRRRSNSFSQVHRQTRATGTLNVVICKQGGGLPAASRSEREPMPFAAEPAMLRARRAPVHWTETHISIR